MTAEPLARRVLRSDAVATRQRIIEAAIRLARRSSIESLTMRDIARAAGVSVATAYTYFASKQHVYAEAYAEGARTLTERLRARPPRGATPADRVASVFRRAVQGVGETGDVVQAMAIALASSDPAVARVRPSVEAAFEEWMELALGDAVIPERAEVVRALQLTMFGGFVAMAHGRLSLADAARVFDVAVRRLLAGA